MMLLIMSGLIVRSMIAISRVNLGFDPRPLLTAQVELPAWKLKSDADVARFYDQIEDRLMRVPGVAAVGAASGLPALAGGRRIAFDVAARPAPSAAERPWAERFTASSGYLSAAGIRLVRGRWFTRADTRETTPVVVINEETARRSLATLIRRSALEFCCPTIMNRAARPKSSALLEPSPIQIWRWPLHLICTSPPLSIHFAAPP